MGETWTTVLKPQGRSVTFNFKEVISYKDLIFLFIKRNYVTKYKQTILGPLWLVISPIITTLMYVLVFGNIAGLSTDGAPQIAFYLSGNIIWMYFSSCVNQTSNTFITNAPIFGKVYFPRLVVPIATAITGLLDFVIQVILLLLSLSIYMFNGIRINMNIWILLTPVLIVQLAMLGMGVGIIVSSLTTKYRDLAILVTFGVQLWMYASPVVYSVSQIPDRYHFLYLLNPVSPIIVIFRYAFLGTGYIPIISWMISWISTITIFFLGIMLFNKVEKNFMDTV